MGRWGVVSAGPLISMLDACRRGQAPRAVRVLAARGALSSRVPDQLAWLILLVEDADAEIAAMADATLRELPAAAIDAFLAGPEATEEVRTFFATLGVPADRTADPGRPTPADETAEEAAEEAEKETEDDEVDAATAQSLVQRLATMSVPQKLARATKGTREERAVLVRDTNKLVAAAVMNSPKLTDTEVEGFARMANVSEDVLRIIASKRQWMKSYATVSALVRNPKTPIMLSMNLLGRLSEKDLRMLSTNRNVPDAIRLLARRRIVIDK